MEQKNSKVPASPAAYLKPYSYKELTALYGISRRTLKNWLAPFMADIGEKRGRYFTIRQIGIIFNKLGLPAPIDGL